MDTKVACVFLLMLGVTHALQCYSGIFGFEDNFDAATATKRTCHSYYADVVYDGCFKSM